MRVIQREREARAQMPERTRKVEHEAVFSGRRGGEAIEREARTLRMCGARGDEESGESDERKEAQRFRLYTSLRGRDTPRVRVPTLREDRCRAASVRCSANEAQHGARGRDGLGRGRHLIDPIAECIDERPVTAGIDGARHTRAAPGLNLAQRSLGRGVCRSAMKEEQPAVRRQLNTKR